MSNAKRPQPIRQSNIHIPVPITFLLERVMRELIMSGAISNQDACRQDHVKLEELRIVIGKGMAIAHRIGTGTNPYHAGQAICPSCGASPARTSAVRLTRVNKKGISGVFICQDCLP